VCPEDIHKQLHEEGVAISGTKNPKRKRSSSIQLVSGLRDRRRHLIMPPLSSNVIHSSGGGSSISQERQIRNKLIQKKKELEKRKRAAANFHKLQANLRRTENEEEAPWVDMEDQLEELRRIELERRAQELRDQDAAYETSAFIDKSKEEERKRIEKEHQRQIEQQQALEEQQLLETEKLKHQKEEQLKNLELNLPPEPQPTDPSAIYHITIQLPNSEKISRSFHQENTLQQVKNFIDTRVLYGKDIPAQYRIISNYPNRVWDDLNQMISDTTFQKRQLLRVEKIN